MRPVVELPVDYARRDYWYRQHHARFVRFVEARGLPCQDCRGAGGWTEPIMDDGGGPFYECGFCEGTGLTTPWLRGYWLRMMRDRKDQLRWNARCATVAVP